MIGRLARTTRFGARVLEICASQTNQEFPGLTNGVKPLTICPGH
jgi:hypothetical protein